MLRKDKHYWRDFTNVQRELLPICEELGRFPSHAELARRRLSSLSRHGIAKHGGARNLARRLGYKTYDEAIGRHSAHHWSYDRTVDELVAFIVHHKCETLPIGKTLERAGRTDLNAALSKHGKARIVSDPRIRSLQLASKQRAKKWTYEAVLEKMRSLTVELGHFPSATDLDRMKLAGLRGALDKHGGSRHFWRLLGRPPHRSRRQIDPATLDDRPGLVQRYRQLAKAIGHAPTLTDLRLLGEDWLGRALTKHFGSLEGVIVQLGIDPAEFGLLKTRDGHFVRSINEALVDNMLCFLGVPHETQGLIDADSDRQFSFDFALTDSNGGRVFVELWGYYAKPSDHVLSNVIKAYLDRKQAKLEFYAKRGLEVIQLDGERFNASLNSIFLYVTGQLVERKIPVRRFKKLPQNAAEFLAYEVYRVDDVVDEARHVVREFGHLPSYGGLAKIGLNALGDRIMKLGGFPEFRSKHGFPRRPVVYKWSASKLLRELQPFIERHGRLPTQRELKVAGRIDLLGALQKQGGQRQFAQKHGLKTLAATPTIYKDFDSLEAIRDALRPLLTPAGKIPQMSVLRSKGPTGLFAAILKIGGPSALAVSLELELQYPPNKDRAYAEMVAKKLAKRLGYLPSAKVMREHGYDSLYQAICNHHGGLAAFARSLGLHFRPERSPVGIRASMS